MSAADVRAGRAPDASWPQLNLQFRRHWGMTPRARTGPPPEPRPRPILCSDDPQILNGRVVRHPFGPRWVFGGRS